MKIQFCSVHCSTEVCYKFGILHQSKFSVVQCTVALKYATNLVYCISQNSVLFSAL